MLESFVAFHVNGWSNFIYSMTSNIYLFIVMAGVNIPTDETNKIIRVIVFVDVMELSHYN